MWGPARVVLGSYAGVTSAIDAPDNITYLDVRMTAGQMWRFSPPPEQGVAWIALHSGSLMCPESVSAGELVVFEEAGKEIEFHAVTDAGFVLGCASKHSYDLVMGRYSVHTSDTALAQGESNIASIGKRLRQEKILR
jgi:hypothetical protein